MANFFWDSCVFYSYLDHATTHDVTGIEQYLNEAAAAKHRIYASSLVFAEVVPSAITRPNIGTFLDFIDDLRGQVKIVEPSPDVLHRAALLKDLPYKKGTSPGRRLSTIDAIMLASCLEVINEWGVELDAFHTLDDGRSRGLSGKKPVPLLSYHEWCEGFSAEQKEIAEPIIQLDRCKPEHPTPDFFSWRQWATNRALADIIPLKNSLKTRNSGKRNYGTEFAR